MNLGEHGHQNPPPACLECGTVQPPAPQQPHGTSDISTVTCHCQGLPWPRELFRSG